MRDRAIPVETLAELGAAHHALVSHHERTGGAAAVVLRLSIDRTGTVRLQAVSLEGLALRSLVERPHLTR